MIGAQWRTGLRVRGHLEARRWVAEVDGSVRAGIYGEYEPDTDELYDLARALNYVRYNTRTSYVRVGVPTRGRLGQGLLVDFYNGGAVWDERRLGLEASLQNRYFRLRGLSSDLAMDRVVAARLEVSPTGKMMTSGGLRLGVGLVTDRRFDEAGTTVPTAREVDLRFTAGRSGGVRFEPFAGAAAYTNYGRGMSLGADLIADNFIDLARVQFRMALQYAEAGFIPGYFGAFYEVSNPAAQIIASEDLGQQAGTPISSAEASTYLLSEFRLVFFERFEFWSAFRRQFGTQSLSTWHLRLFLRSERIHFTLAEDRGGLKGLFSLFNDVGDQSVMSFQAHYRISGPVWMAVSARYHYEAILETDGVTRYAVKRRFEPFVGLRFRLR